jgi:hypothetical protein
MGRVLTGSAPIAWGPWPLDPQHKTTGYHIFYPLHASIVRWFVIFRQTETSTETSCSETLVD